jgi:2-oxo-3-hexenedioate decarboxylase
MSEVLPRGGAIPSGAAGSLRNAAVDELLAAHDGAARLPLLTARQGGLDLEAAYAIADALRLRRIGRGERLLGYKIGFTNRTIWPRYGVHAPIWGPVWDTTVEWFEGTTKTTSLRGLVQPRLEPEIMFGFARAPGRGVDRAGLIDCLEWVAHGFEIVHTHFDDWRFAAPDTVADFALHGRLFVGPRVPLARFGNPGRELAEIDIRLLKDGDEVDAGSGRVVLDGPLDALHTWLLAMQAQPHGWPVYAGAIVTTGTLTDAAPLAAGERWQTALSDPRLPGLTLHTTA